MNGKYNGLLRFSAAVIRRELLRAQVADAVSWSPLDKPERGCTAIIGVCSCLPEILLANLRCLFASSWSELKYVICVVDCTSASFPAEVEQKARSLRPEANITFLYYSDRQSKLTEGIKLGYVYAWLSWCIALSQVRTQHVLFHDYDALLLSQSLGARYKTFADSPAKVQGIRWYEANGIQASDRLATTFEAFFDTQWLRSLRPIQLFNKTRMTGSRSIDLDTTLDIQFNLLSAHERTMVPMGLDDLVHPSQMLCQYTEFRRMPGKPLPCGSMIMIPFYLALGGKEDAVRQAIQALRYGNREECLLLGDDLRINLAQLDVLTVDWQLKQMVQVCVALQIPPDPILYNYGKSLYAIVLASPSEVWKGDFTPSQQTWINAAAGLNEEVGAAQAKK